jgi:hypothetical protein
VWNGTAGVHEVVKCAPISQNYPAALMEFAKQTQAKQRVHGKTITHFISILFLVELLRLLLHNPKTRHPAKL